MSAPDTFLYSPAPHAVHVPPSGPDKPALQVQLLKTVLRSGELEFAGQLMQSPGPAAILYLPGAHDMHPDPE